MGYFNNKTIEITEAYYNGATLEQLSNFFVMSLEEIESILEMYAECDRD
jgi:hypothetical protein